MAYPNLRQMLLGAALTGGCAVAAASSALAQDSTPVIPSPEAAQQMAVEGIDKLLQALDLFVKSVPQYSTPEVLPNGDIILRRVRPDRAPAPTPPKSGDDGSST